MNLQNSKIENECPRREIIAYVDGELSSRAELDLEMHIADCSVCTLELNEQKRLMFALDLALENESNFRLPENFTRVVVANAESKVSGLRCPKERFRAIVVISTLFVAAILGLGGQTKTFTTVFLKFAEQTFTVGGFALHLVYDIAAGASIIIRTFCGQFVNNAAFAVGIPIVFFCLALFALSRLISRFNHS